MIVPVFILAGLAALVGAQDSSTNYTSPYTVDPGTVDAGTKAGWCNSQSNTCLQICNNRFNMNSCTADDLSWTCICTNFATPNISSFQGTIPFFECKQYVANCQTDNTQNLAAQQACLKINCGPNNPATLLAGYSASASSSSASSTSSAAKSTSSGAAASAATATKSAGSAASSVASSVSAATTPTAAAAHVGANSLYGIVGAGAAALVGLAL